MQLTVHSKHSAPMNNFYETSQKSTFLSNFCYSNCYSQIFIIPKCTIMYTSSPCQIVFKLYTASPKIWPGFRWIAITNVYIFAWKIGLEKCA